MVVDKVSNTIAVFNDRPANDNEYNAFVGVSVVDTINGVNDTAVEDLVLLEGKNKHDISQT